MPIKRRSGLLKIGLLTALLNFTSCKTKEKDDVNQLTLTSSFRDTSEIVNHTENNLAEPETPKPDDFINEDRKTRVPHDARLISEENDTAIYKKDGLILTEGILSGEFIEIQRGDYLHLIMKDSLNIYHSFFIMLDDGKRMEELWAEENYPEYKSKIRVRWKRQRIQLTDSYARMIIYGAVKIEQER